LNPFTVERATAEASEENFSHYQRTRMQWGATALPLSAQIEYTRALASIKQGDHEAAEYHLASALSLDPDFPDAYFTLSKVKFRKFNSDALYYMVGGIRALWNNFAAQGLLVLNIVLIASLILIMVSSVVCLAFAARYLPFVAHRLSEYLSNRFNAAAPKFTAYLIVLLPFVAFPGFVTGFCVLLLTTWYFMQRREKFTMIALLLPFVLIAVFAPQLARLTPIASPNSFTMLAARAVNAPGETPLIKAVGNAEARSLEAERHNTLGLLHLRQKNYDVAANHFLQAIAKSENDAMPYINLGNVYFVQEQYEKALEGYRKAEQISGTDPIGQYNLAQAYIKTLLLAESSRALKSAAAHGIDSVKESYAEPVRGKLLILSKTFSPARLWQIAATESKQSSDNIVTAAMAPFMSFPVTTGAWMMLGALILAMIIGRFVKDRHKSFQCSNCGELTCENCCNDERGTYICHSCATSIANVSSDKVIEALLRQRRQAVLVKRRKKIRLVALAIPGTRDIFYGRLSRGTTLATIFSLCAIQVWSHGYVIKDWHSLGYGTPLWKWIIPAAGILMTYVSSIAKKQYHEVRNYRTPSLGRRASNADDENKQASA